MNFYAELHRLRRRVAALERRTKPYEVRVEVSPEAVNLKAINQLIEGGVNHAGSSCIPGIGREFPSGKAL